MGFLGTHQILRARCILSQFNPSGIPILSPEKRAAAEYYATQSPTATPERLRRKAAVLVLVCASVSREGTHVPSIVFTVRGAGVGTHSGEVCFPGGHIDAGEAPDTAALREFREEVGTEGGGGPSSDVPMAVEVLGHSEWVPALSGTPVRGVVGALSDVCVVADTVFAPSGGGRGASWCKFVPRSPAEVESVFTVSIKDLVRTERIERTARLGNSPCYHVYPPGTEKSLYSDQSVPPLPAPGSVKIWGLTALILQPILHQVLVPSFLPSAMNVD